MKHLFKIFMAVYLCMAIITASSATQAKTEKTTKQKPFIIGLLPERNIFEQLDRYQPLADYLSKKMELPIELKVLTRYGNIVDNFVTANMDAAFFGSFTYTLAHSKLGVEAIARPENIHGESTYYGLIFVRRDSGILSSADMRGKRFVFVDKATTAGYLLPLAYFRKHGIKDYRTFLKEAYFSGTHEDAIYDVLNKKADIGAAKNTMFYGLAAKDSRIIEKLMILERSPDVPENGLAVRKDLDDAIKHKLKVTLLNIHTDPEGINVLKKFGAKRFIETSNGDYINVYKYAQEIGLNLPTYNYINE